MPPPADNRRQRAPLPAPRVWLLAAAGLLAVGAIGELSFQGKLQPPTQTADKLPQTFEPAAIIAVNASLSRSARPPAPSAQANARPLEEPVWSEAEKERIRIWAQSAPSAAAGWATALPPGANRHFVLETASLAWGASDDPAAAAQWARSLRDEAERTLALTNIAGEAVRSEPLLALELARSLPEADRDELVPRAAMEWAVQDPEAAADWARRIPGESLRAKVLAGIATVWSDRDPVAGATLAAKELPAGRLQADAVVSIVQRWAQRSPADAAGWLLQFPEGELRDAAMENLEGSAPPFLEGKQPEREPKDSAL